MTSQHTVATSVGHEPPKNRSQKIALTRLIRQLGIAAKSSRVGPEAVVGTALAGWCGEDYPALPTPNLRTSKRLAQSPQLAAFVQALRSLDFLEASYWLSSAYSMLCENSYRKELAMFFTPVSITRGLLMDMEDQGVDFGTQSFMDPACGGAAFLAPIALRMKTALSAKGYSDRAVLEHVEAHLFGTDLDTSLCELSQHFLRMALHGEILRTGYQPTFKVSRANSLLGLEAMYGTLDVVICNPPYRKMNAEELLPLRTAYQEMFESQPNLYGLFIGLSVKLLKEGGRAALVTPTSFLSGQYFSKLRTFLMHNTYIEHIGMVSDRMGVFIDVEQETALTLLQRRGTPHFGETTAKVSVVSTKGEYTDVGPSTLPNSGATWPIPRAVSDVPLLQAAGRSSFRLVDYGYRTRIGAFVWNRDERPTFESADVVRREKRKTAVPLLWSSDISLSGEVAFDELQANPGEHRFVDLGSRTHSSVILKPSVVLQRVTSNSQARRLVAAATPQRLFDAFGGFVGENHVVVLEPIGDDPVLTPHEMAHLLSVEAVDRCFRCISGATNVSAFELGQLPLPNPAELRTLLASGLSISEAVNRTYGLSHT
ncbi:class I SAM-dependent DNA methyltransferase [Hydrogenophaga sp.]|uniref:HsdM family class I SAM-dependent methyltransferase n=1 Tax=Hydrogenophaga sp. TaxID=1904254 RepID=UPI0027289062|nr:N-6 DNA methylase [Hydrogenophaga sp.]MDO9506594.1 N-6 DNA methylase [Hydrogenophaga sp.]